MEIKGKNAKGIVSHPNILHGHARKNESGKGVAQMIKGQPEEHNEQILYVNGCI